MLSDLGNIGSTLETQRWQLPPLPAKKCKARPAYRKSDAVKALEEMYIEDHRSRYPSMPEYARTCKRYEDRTANGLTKCVIDFIRLNGYQAERINCTGRYVDNTQVVENVLGDKRRIGSAKWLPTSGQRGTADISAVIRGRAVKIEVKIKDRQSDDQKRYQADVEKAGGVYLLVRSFEEFKQWFDEQAY